MARRISGVGLVTVSLRRSMVVTFVPEVPLADCGSRIVLMMPMPRFGLCAQICNTVWRKFTVTIPAGLVWPNPPPEKAGHMEQQLEPKQRSQDQPGTDAPAASPPLFRPQEGELETASSDLRRLERRDWWRLGFVM